MVRSGNKGKGKGKGGVSLVGEMPGKAANQLKASQLVCQEVEIRSEWLGLVEFGVL